MIKPTNTKLQLIQTILNPSGFKDKKSNGYEVTKFFSCHKTGNVYKYIKNHITNTFSWSLDVEKKSIMLATEKFTPEQKKEMKAIQAAKKAKRVARGRR